MPRRGLHAETVQHRSENVVVIETVDQRFVQHHFIGHGSVDHALIQIGGAKSPDLAGEHHVVAVMHLGKVIERARLFGEGKEVRPAVVFDADVAFFDIDIRRAVFAHRAELDQVAIGLQLPESRKEHSRCRTQGYVAHKKYATVADLLGLGGHTTDEKVKNLVVATEQLLDRLGFPRSIADLGISAEEFERAMPELTKLAFDDPSWRSNPRMPLMSELADLFWKAYQGRGPASVVNRFAQQTA